MAKRSVAKKSVAKKSVAKKSVARGPLTAEPEVWHELLDLTDQFRELAPWQWMDDRHLFGVHDPASDEVIWCGVMGKLGQVLGMVFYPGDVGWNRYQDLVESAVDEFEASYSMRCYRLVLADRGELHPDFLRLLAGLGRSYRGRNAWPELLDFTPGFEAIPISDGVAKSLLHVLGEALAVCARLRVDPKLVAGAPLVRRAGADTRPPLPKRTTRLPESGPDDVSRMRARKLAVVEATWLGDFFHQPALINERPRPFYARGFIWADADSGMILDVDIQGPEAGASHLRARLLSLERIGALPKRLVVRRVEAFEALRGLDERIEVIHAPDSHAFVEIRKLLGRMFSGRSHL